MTLAVPTALFWLLLAAPIIALYVLRVRLHRVPVSTGMFWKQLYNQKAPHSLWNRFRHLISLLLQLLLLFMLAIALADPYFPWQRNLARQFVIVIDPSASMQATDVAPTRFEAARQKAHEIVTSLTASDEMAIVVAGPSPRVAIGMSNHQRTLHQVIGELEPIDAAADLHAAIELAQNLAGQQTQTGIVVLTDGCDKSTLNTTNADEPASIDYHWFASDAANVGITQFRTRRSPVDPLGYEILVEVTNASPYALQCQLELEMDKILVDVLPLKLAPNDTWGRSIKKASDDGGVITATLRFSDGDTVGSAQGSNERPNHLAVDDIAYCVLPDRSVQKVLLVTPGNVFLQKVLEANPLVALKVVQTPPVEWPTDALIILHRQVPERVPIGAVLVVDPTNDTDLWHLGEKLRDPIVSTQDNESPLMTHVRLDNVVMPYASRITINGPAEILATSATDDPIYAVLPRKDGHCLLLNANLEEGDLAFRTTFPILISNALNWFASVKGELTPEYLTGNVVIVPITNATSNGDQHLPRLIHPDGSSTSLVVPHSAGTAINAFARFEALAGPLMQAGIYRVESGRSDGNADSDHPVTLIPASLLNAWETDLRPRRTEQETSASLTIGGSTHNRPFWFYLTAIACLLSLTEWAAYNRRYTD